MRLLYVRWDSLMRQGVENAIGKIVSDYIVFSHPIINFDEDEAFETQLEKEVRGNHIDTVFSINFFPIISKVCERNSIKYISWGYDAPIKESAWKYLGNSCNEIYDFDRGQVTFFQKKGISNIYHMPLASDFDTFQGIIRQEDHQEKYRSQVSFVGKLYTSDYAIFYSAVGEHVRGYLEACINAQKTITSGYLIPEIMRDDIYEEIMQDLKKNGVEQKFSKLQIEYLLAEEAVRRNRYLALSLLAGKYETVLYSPDLLKEDSLIQKGIVDYYTEMPLVFANSSINLNISLNAIKTGIPLRALDIMGSGGFLLTNPQEEILENMVIGEECDVFTCPEELLDKVKYYIEHEDCRNRIAKNGLEKMKKCFDFRERIERILK